MNSNYVFNSMIARERVEDRRQAAAAYRLARKAANKPAYAYRLMSWVRTRFFDTPSPNEVAINAAYIGLVDEIAEYNTTSGGIEHVSQKYSRFD